MSSNRFVSCAGLLGLLLAAGAQAQDAAAPAAEAPAAEAAAAEAPAGESAETAPAEAAAPEAAAAADAGSPSTEAAPAADSGEPPTVAADSGEAAAGGTEPLQLYGGVDYAFVTASLSKDSLKTALGGETVDSNFYRLRFGARLLPAIGVEAQYGIKGSGNDADTQSMYGLYVVPTGVFFDLVEISAPVGYAHVELKNSSGKAKFDAASFGFNMEVPVYINEGGYIPAIRVGGGGTVYYAGSQARVYGFQAGLRMDFKL
ncbi:hypothetical protein SAMN04488038_10826 [Solimonas aquatica]|uniref:Outer membrane protein beta-barrel domain-containing protein n=1 Tax=Solimonas aquatica TaxID=489703 RepID=A0A1H9H4X3_9GAMM|nr:hypothetical protein [Solimonas aquatica]SEQ57421.1 hypothetical protein SAMN04488038_10826 [Solimonas aquatica]